MLIEKEKKNENTKCKRNTRGKRAESVVFKRSRKEASVSGPLISDYFKGWPGGNIPFPPEHQNVLPEDLRCPIYNGLKLQFPQRSTCPLRSCKIPSLRKMSEFSKKRKFRKKKG